MKMGMRYRSQPCEKNSTTEKTLGLFYLRAWDHIFTALKIQRAGSPTALPGTNEVLVLTVTDQACQNNTNQLHSRP